MITWNLEEPNKGRCRKKIKNSDRKADYCIRRIWYEKSP